MPSFPRLEARGPVVRRWQGRYEVIRQGEWTDLGSVEELNPYDKIKGDGPGDYTRFNEREVGILCRLLDVGQYVLLSQDGAWSIGDVALMRYTKTEFPRRRNVRLW